jgi:glyoxylase-like metal-dependent hydrolase (beta-lactamase superfamily II)
MSWDETDLPEVRRYESNTGARIYCVTCLAFPGFAANIYLVLEAGPPTLIDTGSGFWNANKQLVEGLARIGQEFNESVQLTDVKRIVITHGHIDHIGGLPYLHEQLPKAEIFVHQLDVRILTAYEERVAVAKKAFRRFLEQSGVEAELLPGFMEMYGFSKQNVHRLPVTRTLADNDRLDDLRFIHTPGHCPGQVCIALGNVLFSADHILPEISPHQAPESIMPYTGLGHYLESLDKIGRTGGFDLALGGHGAPIREVYKRITEIHQGHQRKLEKVLTTLRESPEPMTVNEISQKLYTHVEGFHILLALEEVAAHVEYLYQRGMLAIADLAGYQSEENPPVRYVVD